MSSSRAGAFRQPCRSSGDDLPSGVQITQNLASRRNRGGRYAPTARSSPEKEADRFRPAKRVKSFPFVSWTPVAMTHEAEISDSLGPAGDAPVETAGTYFGPNLFWLGVSHLAGRAEKL